MLDILLLVLSCTVRTSLGRWVVALCFYILRRFLSHSQTIHALSIWSMVAVVLLNFFLSERFRLALFQIWAGRLLRSTGIYLMACRLLLFLSYFWLSASNNIWIELRFLVSNENLISISMIRIISISNTSISVRLRYQHHGLLTFSNVYHLGRFAI